MTDTDERIELCAFWGSDGEAEVRMSYRDWLHVCAGGKLSRTGRTHRDREEGIGIEEVDVHWTFKDREVYADCDDGLECYIGSLDGLYRFDALHPDEKVEVLSRAEARRRLATMHEGGE
jgi:hypothetical protein